MANIRFMFCFCLMEAASCRLIHLVFARAHGMWTYEPRQGRNAATVVCSASAVVTLAFMSSLPYPSLRSDIENAIVSVNTRR